MCRSTHWVEATVLGEWLKYLDPQGRDTWLDRVIPSSSTFVVCTFRELLSLTTTWVPTAFHFANEQAFDVNYSKVEYLLR